MLSTRRRIVGAKIEGTAGTAEATLETAFYGYNSTIVNNVAFTARNAAGTLTQLSAQPGIESGQHNFSVELVKSAAWAAVLMPTLGMALTTGVWAPSDDPDDWGWASTGHNQAGKLYKISGALSSAKFNLVAGQVPTVDFSCLGRYEAEADAAQFTPTFTLASQSAGIRLTGATTTMAGTAIGFSSATLEIANTVSLLLDVNATGGIAHAWIEDRVIQLTIDPLEELVATRNDDGIQRAKTLQAFSMAWGDMLITMPKCQLRQIASGERNGLSARALTFVGTMSSAAGDEFGINFATA